MKIELFDTTLRDGTQAEHVSLSAEDKIRIARRLDEFGIDVIEGGWPGSNPKDQEFFERASDQPWKHAQICAFGSTRRASHDPADDPNLRALIAAGTSVVSIFGKSWTLHAEVALGVSLEENLQIIASSVAYLRDQGKRVIYDAEHFFDGYKADRAYALATLSAAAGAGADVLVLCDTNGGTLPSELRRIVGDVYGKVSGRLGIHTHNDAGCAVANSLAAVEAGVTHVQGTINGIGERCGNADLCSIIPGLQLKMGYDCVDPERLSSLADVSGFVDDIANLDPVGRSPYVGRSAFAHKGGVHVSAVMKDPRAYEHLDPDVVGNRRRVLVSDLSGRSNVVYKANELGLEVGTSAQAQQAVARIKELENLGYSFEAAEASFELLVRSMKGEDTQFFDLERLHVRSEMGDNHTQCSEATVAVRVAGHRELSAAEGDGPVDAISRALRKALEPFYPQLDGIRLSDYKVRVLNPDRGTAASVRVLIEHHDGERAWNTVGVSENIIDASWQALSDGIAYGLLSREVKPSIATGDAIQRARWVSGTIAAVPS
ncbi:MAG: citramalate synthase [Rhodothermales bacterium]|nr:citramalate synthase [Rhodothermales bacterium]